jgi:tetratricopeptide (TPR) repeat protein
MKKPILVVMAFLLVSVALIPVYADITGYTWVGTTYTGYDEYYQRDVNAYKVGSTAVLAVRVNNTQPSQAINITSVRVAFDWGGAPYNSTQVTVTNPQLMQAKELRVFSIEFQVPDTSVASNLFVHSYTITVDYKYGSTTGKYEKIGTDFAVYSDDQADAMNMKRMIDVFNSTLQNYKSPISQIYWNKTFSGSFVSIGAQILWFKAMNETLTGRRYYKDGQFDQAKTHFQWALGNISEAWGKEEDYLQVLEESQSQEAQARIRYLDAMTSFFNGLSTMWVLFGIGGVLFSIGYIIKWLRAKRPEPQEPQEAKATAT